MTSSRARAGAVAASPGRRDLLCPSAQPNMHGALAIGVVDHRRDPPEISYLEAPQPVTDDLLRMVEPIRPTEIFRFAAPCQTSACSHWSGSDCQLIDRVVKLIPVASLHLPTCRIRPECRWYAQAGRSACVRCSRVVTQNEDPDEAMRGAASPAPSRP
jgi:hypothetical protein